MYPKYKRRMFLILYLLKYFYLSTPINSFLDDISKAIERDGVTRTHSYVGVIDAGSTGTRLNIFGFLLPERILNFYFIERVSPGIHTLENEKILNEEMNNLFKKAENKLKDVGISLEQVPMVFQGTAGMRSLGFGKRLRILNAIRKFFMGKNILLKNASVITGFEEGNHALHSLIYLNNYSQDVIKEYACRDRSLKEKINKHNSDFCSKSSSDDVKERPYFGLIDMGGGSTQVAYEFDINTEYSDPIHVIEGNGRKIYINSYEGWGLKEALIVFKENGLSDLQNQKEKKNIFTELLKDFKIPKQINVNDLDKIFLLSFFYSKFLDLGCETITNLENVNNLFDEKCKGVESRFCNEIYYMKSFLEAQGITKDKNLYLVHDIAGINLNWSLSQALKMV